MPLCSWTKSLLLPLLVCEVSSCYRLWFCRWARAWVGHSLAVPLWIGMWAACYVAFVASHAVMHTVYAHGAFSGLCVGRGLLSPSVFFQAHCSQDSSLSFLWSSVPPLRVQFQSAVPPSPQAVRPEPETLCAGLQPLYLVTHAALLVQIPTCLYSVSASPHIHCRLLWSPLLALWPPDGLPVSTVTHSDTSLRCGDTDSPACAHTRVPSPVLRNGTLSSRCSLI